MYGLSPEERERIYYEEKARMDAQEEINAENTKKGCMGCLTVIGVIFAISLVISLFSGGSSRETTSEKIMLHGTAKFTGTQFVITNNDEFAWSNTVLTLNPGFFDSYKLTLGDLEAGQTCIVGAAQLTKSNGERFNPFTHKPCVLLITAYTPDGEGVTGFQF